MANSDFGRKGVSSLLSLFVILSSLVLSLPEISSPAVGLEFSKPNIKVDQMSMNAHYPSIALDGQGVLHAVWEDNIAGGSVICYSNSTDSGLSWSPEVTISPPWPGWKFYKPKIAVDLSSPSYQGSIYVTYETNLDGWSVWVSYSHDSGQSWNVSQVDHGGMSVRSHQPAIGVVGNGTVYVAWKDGRTPVYQIFVSASHDGAGTWATDRRVSITDEWNVKPSIATHGLSDVYIIWQEYYETYYSAIWSAHSSDGENWSASRVADSQTYRIVRENPDVRVDPSGAVFVVWAFREQDLDWIIEFSRSDDSGVTWTDSVRVDHGGRSVRDLGPPRMSVGGGNIYVAWSCDGIFIDESIYFTYSADGGGTWGDQGELSMDVLVDDTHGNGDPSDDNTAQRYPAIASSAYEVFVIWEDKRSQTSWHVYFAKTIISSLHITEIRDSPDGQEAVEIYNYGGSDWDLTTVVLRIEGEGDTSLSPLGTIPAGEYRAIGDSPSMDLTIDITLGDEGGFLYLLKGVKILDALGYGQKGTAPDPLGGEAVARHWTGLRYTYDWVREPLPTFGFDNDVPLVDERPRIVLNEVLFNPLLPSDAFVEIILREGENIDTDGYMIVCDSAHVMGSVILTNENPTYAVLQSRNPTFFAEITPSGDNVYLYDPAGNLMDMVGWNTAHNAGLSVARVPEGNGTHDGYDDASSARAGWDFDQTPTPSVISVGPDQWKNGDPAETVSYTLTVANRGSGSDYVDITYLSEPNGWVVGLFQGDGTTPLSDSPADGDGVPDVGLLGSLGSTSIVVKVTIPAAPEAGSCENTTVIATSSNNPSLLDNALLVTRPYPAIAVDKSLSPQEVYIETAGPGFVKEATITLEVRGTGSSVYYDTPQDVIFLIDRSESIGSTNFTLEKNLALTYLKQLRPPDRAAVVFFEGIPIFKRTLSENYEEVEADLRGETGVSSEPTRIGPALNETAHNLFEFGDKDHKKMIFLFTDGLNWWFPVDRPPFNDPHPWDVAAWSTLHNISIYPFGIRGVSGGPERWLLEEMASITGTRYVFVNSTHVMDGMRDEIGLIEKSIAAYDPDVTDPSPLVQDGLPDYIHYVPGSAVDPDTGAERAPIIDVKGDTTYLKWNVPLINVEENWSVSFRVTCAVEGHHLANVYDLPDDSRVMGYNWNDDPFIVTFPLVYIDCLPPLLKPDAVSARLEGPFLGDVNITWSLSPADPGVVDRYEVYYGNTFDPTGGIYTLLDTVPAGTDYYLLAGLGEGDPDSYYFQICAVASTGPRACADGQAGKFIRPLAPGPNLVSIPLVQSNESIERVLQTVKYDEAWFYDSLSGDWTWYMTFKNYRRGMWKLNHTMGLWVNVTEDSNLTVAGMVPAQTLIRLQNGWNLVGFPSFNTTYNIADLKAEVGVTRAEGLDSAMLPYCLGVLADADGLQAGYGYWVKVEVDTVWTVSIQ